MAVPRITLTTEFRKERKNWVSWTRASYAASVKFFGISPTFPVSALVLSLNDMATVFRIGKRQLAALMIRISHTAASNRLICFLQFVSFTFGFIRPPFQLA